MKKIIIVVLILIVAVPPIQVHSKGVFYDYSESHTDTQVHEADHYQNKTHSNEQGQHHHCNLASLVLMFVSNSVYNLQHFPLFIPIKRIDHYQATYYNSYLNNIFQPPRRF
ncbi:MAG: hypothetical protein ACK5H1_02520 [Tenacibaculum sp.]